MHSLRVLVGCAMQRQGVLGRAVSSTNLCRLASSKWSIPEPTFVVDDPRDIELSDEEKSGPFVPNFPSLQCPELFFFPQFVSPAHHDYELMDEQLLQKGNAVMCHNGQRLCSDFELKVQPMPKLLISYLKSIFYRNCEGFQGFRDSMEFTTISLKFNCDVDLAINTFLEVAIREAHSIAEANYWVDFVNPHTGRAHYAPATAELSNCQNFGLAGQHWNYENVNGCTIVKDGFEKEFTGTIYTDAPVKIIKNWCCSEDEL
ncbi:uncharacterized protein LOC117584564 [Drosophila guanche]|uniref:Methylmalonic aciduria and homocystinuria type D homolog, mitochondrial n=1 Tax=Drosophila guanche TaxID=7266 RepID=A0A3B0K8R8_DROGU|nr:uncharacterized protein LOC117584564 [Drosophila guanche]SPP81421.1 Hypothetical predicted protein [Drosophila guanche]